MKNLLVRMVAILALMAAMVPDDAFCKGGASGGGGGRGSGGLSGGGASRGFSGSSGGIKSGSGVKASSFGGSGGSNRSSTWGSGNASKATASSPKVSGGGASKSWGQKSAPAAAPAPKITGGGASKTWKSEPAKPTVSSPTKAVAQKAAVKDLAAKAPVAESAGPSFSVERDTTAKKQSASAAVDERMREKAAMSGSGTKSRAEQINALKAREAKSYQTTFAKEPTTRPDYVPQSTKVDGTTVNVVYNTRYGGYGYMFGGSWRSYDPFMDLLMWDMLLNRHAAPVVVASPDYAVVYPQSGGGGAGFAVGMILFVVVIGACVCVVVTRR